MVAFLIGVVAAILLALTRWQAVHLLPADWYYRILTVHGLNMLIFFIIFFEMAILYFAGPIALSIAGSRPPSWAGRHLGLMVVGAVMVDWMVLRRASADVLFTSYVPLRADPQLLPGNHPLRRWGHLIVSRATSSPSWWWRNVRRATRVPFRW